MTDLLKIVENYKEELNSLYTKGWHPINLFGSLGTAVKVFEIQTLYAIIKEKKYSNILEIGTGTGLSSLYIAKALGSKGHHFGTLDSIDISADAQKKARELHANCGLAPTLTNFICGNSTEILPLIDREYDFCLLDGSHDYAITKQDFINIFPKIKAGGCVAFHDIQPTIKKTTPHYVWKEIISGELVNLEEVEIYEFDEKLYNFFSYESDFYEHQRLANKWSTKNWIGDDVDPCKMMSVVFKK